MQSKTAIKWSEPMLNPQANAAIARVEKRLSEEGAGKRPVRRYRPATTQEIVSQAVAGFIDNGGVINKIPPGGPLADKLAEMEE